MRYTPPKPKIILASASGNAKMVRYRRTQRRKSAQQSKECALSNLCSSFAVHAAAHNNLGSALAQQGKWGKAAVAHRKALQINPEYANAAENLAAKRNQIKEENPAAKRNQRKEENPNVKKELAAAEDKYK